MGTPLYVRARPNGAIVGALYNGVTVYVRDMTVDREGRRWAYVVPLKAGKAGWVFREYINCRGGFRSGLARKLRKMMARPEAIMRYSAAKGLRFILRRPKPRI